MTDKKTFGSFIKSKRTEKNLSQKDLAEMLFVTEGAVSKWERGISYPDNTLIADICRVLEISEHELITASTDTETRKLKQEAKNYRTIRGAWFWIPTISYILALIPCFICDLAINGTLSWFFIVLTALVCAYSFVPTFTSFFRSKKLLAFTVTSYLSICLLLFTCAAYTGTMSWFLTACLGTLIGYEMVFLPILLHKTRLSRYKFVIAFTAACLLTVLLLVNVYTWQPFMLGSAILITIYAYIPAIFCTAVCTLHFDSFLKAGVCTLASGIVYYFTNHVINALFHLNENHYEINFHDWAHYVNGNVHFIVLISVLSVSAIFLAIGSTRRKKKQ